MDPEFWTNLQNFGMATMAAGGQPGATTLGALGQGGLGMNQAAQQRAQTQLLGAQTQHAQLENQLVPYQINMMKQNMDVIKSYQDQMDNYNSGGVSNPPAPSAGQPWSGAAGGVTKKPQTRTQPVNNPGNLRPVGATTGFQQFNTPEAGMDAMKADLLAKISGSPSMKGQPPTLRNLISTYAPPTENDTPSYIKNVSQGSGIDPDQTLTATDVDKIMPLMIKQEGNSPENDNLSPFQQRRQNIAKGLPPMPPPAIAILNPEMAKIMQAQYEHNPDVIQAEAEAKAQAEAGAKGEEERKTKAFTVKQDIAAAGPKKEAEDTAATKAAAEKTLNVMQSNLPVVLQRFKQMSDAAKTASYGFGVDNEGEGSKQVWHNQFNDATSQSNAILRQRSAQGILPELGPQLAQAGIRGNKFLETLASSASGLNLADSPDAKAAAIDGLKQQYIQNLKSTARQVKAMGGEGPSEAEIDAMAKKLEDPVDLTKYKNPGMIRKAYKSGELPKEQALILLRQNHGMQ